MIKNCGNCGYGNEGICSNCFGFEGFSCELSTYFKCKNWKFKIKMIEKEGLEYFYGYIAGGIIFLVSLLITQIVFLLILWCFSYYYIILLVSFTLNSFLSVKIILYFIKKSINRDDKIK